MSAYIKGILTASSPSEVVIEAGGIGYQVFIPKNAFGKLPQVGEPLSLQTSYIVRELSHTLYGFLTIHEKELFELLMEVSGIGPKIALGIIGGISPSDLATALASNNISALCRIPGIGKKTAERLIIELRDKLPTTLSAMTEGLSTPLPTNAQSQVIQDAMSTLINLGYNQLTAQKAIKKALHDSSETESNLAQLITISLKHI